MSLSTEEIAALPYRPCVGIMLLNRTNQVFVGQRIDTTAEAWQMPQGGIDDGEDAYAAALRELHEETGVTQVSLIGECPVELHYDLPPELVPKLWGGCYRGQRQRWFALRLEAEDTHINITTEIPEFRAWQWADLQDLPRLIVPFKRALYAQLIEQFQPLLTKTG